jgi:hypothetical protein
MRISSTSEDLEAYRAAARDVVSHLGWQPVRMEDFGTDGSAGVGHQGRLNRLCSVRKAKCGSGESPRHATHSQAGLGRCSDLTLPP